ncbi:histidine phosphatase family protein [Marisediminicola senii]|uniref:histidine phosphatase family protein n=1 Tax=Marisediminicola senii TaxID=2711233 RepID=UPI0013EB8DA1|nr:histidine phosphatase family protein [Marisediminicola senii]
MTEASHLLLARHGRTALNAEGRLRGLANPPLDDAGIAEATRLGAALASAGITAVVCSPLDRAQQTAHIVARAAAVAVHTDDRLNDRDYGSWTGHLTSEVVSRWGSIDRAPGVESTNRVLARVLPALDDVIRHRAPVAIVTHDAVIRPVLQFIDPSRTGLAMPTGSWSDIALTRSGWVVESVDNVPA